MIEYEAEGVNLSDALARHLFHLTPLNRKVEELASGYSNLLLDKFHNRLAELGVGVKVDQSRLV
ncbi:MAG: hypothetical protein AMR96_05600 [Candidatus Adiutrix intracellularis]|jgi:hypothetical protein|nr:MAG: hypothetical protein AMR96_05600 [Candidatus Adiutrix intracellularis]MDR2827502.1 hypothetical protein [Candidatus Adiutrix intracellularis]